MRLSSILGITSLATLTALAPTMAGCSAGSANGNSGPSGNRQVGQSDFQSAPPAGQSSGGSFAEAGGAADTNGATSAAPTAGVGAGNAVATDPRAVAETDIYRLENNTLYYLNSYRGLMVFDVTNVDAPKLLGRSPVFGDPIQMTVTGGVATMILGDWYGSDVNGDPFYGSVVRTVDATDPTNIKTLGEVQVTGYVRDSRTVGNTLYLVSEDDGWEYGYWGYGYYGGGVDEGTGVATPGVSEGSASVGLRAHGHNRQAITANANRARAHLMAKNRVAALSGKAPSVMDPITSGAGPKTLITSINLSTSTAPVLISTLPYAGYQGAFNVTDSTIILAHDVPTDPTNPYSAPSGVSALEYLDISNPNGTVVSKASFQVAGSFSGWGTDSGRWNVDYNETTHIAHVITCGENQGGWYCGGGGSMVLSTVDFTAPAAPVLDSALNIPSSGWSAAARFDTNRLYLSPGDGYYSSSNQTPVQIFDTTDPKNPILAGSTNITGQVWNFTPMNGKIFALGNNYNDTSSQVSVQYIDATDATKPVVLGAANFGGDWAWTPAADTFKAFLLDTTDNLVVLPFSGWSSQSSQYNDGLQLIQFTPTTIATAGASHTKGWVERGIIVKNRLVSLSDMALSVVDYTNQLAPVTTATLTLARNVVDAHADGTTISQLSTDWWGYDTSSSDLRVLPIADAQEMSDESAATDVSVPGTNAQVFRNGDMAYVVTDVYANNNDSSTDTEVVTVVDLSNGGAKIRGTVTLPTAVDFWGYDGYYGCYWDDWWDSSAIVQVQGNALAFRRVQWQYNSQTGVETGDSLLYIVDITNPDAPQVNGATITQQNDWWWGNVQAVGDNLYTSHYEWSQYPTWDPNTGKSVLPGIVKYYLDRVNLADRAHPVVDQTINTPGLLVGASQTDPTLLYFVDYRWDDSDTTYPHDEFSVAQINGNKAYLQSTTAISGWTGNVFVQGNTAYTSAIEYNANGPYDSSAVIKLHQIDITNPSAPVDYASTSKAGWGWLLDVEGDRAIITSGWGSGLDIYKLTANQAPIYDQYARSRGWWPNSLSRQDNTLYLSSGYWGVQSIVLQ